MTTSTEDTTQKNETPVVEDQKQETQAASAASTSTNSSATQATNSLHALDPGKLNILNEVSISLTIEVGRAQIKIRDLLNLTKDSIIDLNKMAGEPVDIYANGKLLCKGVIVTANGKYCVRLTSMPEIK